MSEAKKNAAPAGGRYLSEDGKAAEAKAQKRAQEKQRREKQARSRERILTSVGLFLGDGILIYMVLNGLIEQIFGVLFVAALSVIAGCQMKR